MKGALLHGEAEVIHHRRMKQRVRPMFTSRRFDHASLTLPGSELVHPIKKGHCDASGLCSPHTNSPHLGGSANCLSAASKPAPVRPQFVNCSTTDPSSRGSPGFNINPRGIATAALLVPNGIGPWRRRRPEHGCAAPSPKTQRRDTRGAAESEERGYGDIYQRSGDTGSVPVVLFLLAHYIPPPAASGSCARGAKHER